MYSMNMPEGSIPDIYSMNMHCGGGFLKVWLKRLCAYGCDFWKKCQSGDSGSVPEIYSKRGRDVKSLGVFIR